MSIKMRMPKLTSVRGQTLLTDTKPYLYRQSPIESQMLEDMIVGGTVAWNQLVDNTKWTMNALFGDLSVSGTELTITAGAPNSSASVVMSGINFVAGHCYVCVLSAKTSGNGVVRYMYPAIASNTINTSIDATFKQCSFCVKATGARANHLIYWNAVNNVAEGTTITIKDVLIIDLTQMFDSTVADYVYSLETQTAGSGIAWLKSFGFFNKDFFPFDSGSLLSVKTSGHKTEGKNLCEVASLADNAFWGGSYSSLVDIVNALPVGTYTISHKAKILTMPSNGIVQHGAFYITAMVDGSQVPVNTYSTTTDNSPTLGKIYEDKATFTITEVNRGNINHVYAYCDSSVHTGTGRGLYSIYDIQIEYGASATAYEPYSPTVYPLSDIELRGIPKLDASNNLYYDGDTYESSGQVTRKYGTYTFTGNETWTLYVTGGHNTFNSGGRFLADSKPLGYGIISNEYQKSTASYISNMADKTFQFFSSPSFSITDDSYTNANEFAQHMAGATIVYELETPTTETTDAFTNPQQAGTTEEYVDERTVPMPVGHVTEYFNMVQKEQIQMHMGQAQAIKMHMPKGD